MGTTDKTEVKSPQRCPSNRGEKKMQSHVICPACWKMTPHQPKSITDRHCDNVRGDRGLMLENSTQAGSCCRFTVCSHKKVNPEQTNNTAEQNLSIHESKILGVKNYNSRLTQICLYFVIDWLTVSDRYRLGLVNRDVAVCDEGLAYRVSTLRKI